jgi:hypothetical protein
MIPHQITKSHLLRAIRLLERGVEIVPPRRRSKKFDLLYRGHKYPPKYVVSVAYKEINGGYLHDFAGGSETNNFLAARDFTVVWKDGRPVQIVPIEEDEESSFPEGAEKYRMHRSYERDSRITKLAKKMRIKRVGELSCDVCGFSFCKRYGGLGIGYIEAHHTAPVSQLGAKLRTRLVDIALVCSNCHRMLHRERPWLSLKDLKRHLKKLVT